MPRAHRRRRARDQVRLRLGADQVRGDRDGRGARRAQLLRRGLDRRLVVERGGEDRRGQPGGQQHAGDLGLADRRGVARRGHDEAGRGGHHRHQPYPVGAGEARVGEPVVQRLGDERMRAERLGREGVPRGARHRGADGGVHDGVGSGGQGHDHRGRPVLRARQLGEDVVQVRLVPLQVPDAGGLARVLDLDEPDQLGGDLGAGTPGGAGNGQDQRGGAGGSRKDSSPRWRPPRGVRRRRDGSASDAWLSGLTAGIVTPCVPCAGRPSRPVVSGGPVRAPSFRPPSLPVWIADLLPVPAATRAVLKEHSMAHPSRNDRGK